MVNDTRKSELELGNNGILPKSWNIYGHCSKMGRYMYILVRMLVPSSS